MAKMDFRQIFARFFKSNSLGGLVLFCCVIISLIIANSAYAENFEIFWKRIIPIASFLQLDLTIRDWINDGLMAVFFLHVGLEIKREIIKGELSSVKKAVLPVIAACGGAIMPAVIYALFNLNQPTASGWGIPMATDIAFALAVISLLGKRVPIGLKVFLTALAIADDLIAILVIAIFYSENIELAYLLYAAGIIVIMIIFNLTNVRHIWFYLLPGIALWYCMHHSGIHATIAGVITSYCIPLKKDKHISPLEKLEHLLTIPVTYFILPLFALSNTNITLQVTMIKEIFQPLGMGIIIGLFVGKLVGILLATKITVSLKWGDLPHRVGWWHIAGAAMLGGIGFTMSIFVSLLSFNNVAFINEAKLAILIASLIAGIAGYLFLCVISRNHNN